MTIRYFPHTDDDIREMLADIGCDSIEDLFATIPPVCRLLGDPALPKALDEWELRRHFERLADHGGGDWQVFLGAGSQAHRIPAIVPYLASRSEFLTSYTPYQPEMSQGTLQAIFEFQTLISRLTGLPVTNASMYDGASAMAEAVLMALRITKRRHVVVSKLVHPHWRQVLNTYLAPMTDVEISVLPTLSTGRTDLDAFEDMTEPAILVMQSPNFLGIIENMARAADLAHAAGGLLAAGFSEPFALGVIKSPGALGADIAFGEGQSLGLPPSFGGPGLGLLSTRAEHMRQIPGRLVGETRDNRGRRGFVLTLATREQHIRRGRAVSNICTNAGHSALTAAIFMAAMGRTGFRSMAQLNHDLAEYMIAQLFKVGFLPLSVDPVFNEFTLKAPRGFGTRYSEMQGDRILAGMPVESFYPEFKNAWLFGVTEVFSREDIDAFIREVSA